MRKTAIHKAYVNAEKTRVHFVPNFLFIGAEKIEVVAKLRYIRLKLINPRFENPNSFIIFDEIF